MAKIKLRPILGKNAHWNLNKSLVRQLGLTETLVLQHIIDLTESAFKKNEIFQPYEDMANELGISEYSIKQAVGKLKSADLINVERKSVGFKNFYSVNAEKVMEYVSGSINSLAHTNPTHQSVEGQVHTKSTNSAYEKDSLEHTNTTLSEVDSTNSAYEMIGAITNNTTNNTEEIIQTNNTTNTKAGNIKNITEKILDVITNPNSELYEYNAAIEDYNELGGINGIAKIMEWDDSVKRNYVLQINNINAIR